MLFLCSLSLTAIAIVSKSILIIFKTALQVQQQGFRKKGIDAIFFVQKIIEKSIEYVKAKPCSFWIRIKLIIEFCTIYVLILKIFTYHIILTTFISYRFTLKKATRIFSPKNAFSTLFFFSVVDHINTTYPNKNKYFILLLI